MKKKRLAKDTGVRLLVPHGDACAYAFGLNGPDPHVFYCADDSQDGNWLTVHGTPAKRGRHHLWHRFSCNDSNCSAIAIVRADKISDLISKALR